MIDRLLAGVSTRSSRWSASPSAARVQRAWSATSKTSVSELFVERTRSALGELMGRRLDDVGLVVMMLDGLQIADRTHVVALGISTEGVKISLGLWKPAPRTPRSLARCWPILSTTALTASRLLFVIDGARALRGAINDVFGEHALAHRCHRHKERNVTDLLSEHDREQRPSTTVNSARGRMRAAWALTER